MDFNRLSDILKRAECGGRLDAGERGYADVVRALERKKARKVPVRPGFKGRLKADLMEGYDRRYWRGRSAGGWFGFFRMPAFRYAVPALAMFLIAGTYFLETAPKLSEVPNSAPFAGSSTSNLERTKDSQAVPAPRSHGINAGVDKIDASLKARASYDTEYDPVVRTAAILTNILYAIILAYVLSGFVAVGRARGDVERKRKGWRRVKFWTLWFMAVMLGGYLFRMAWYAT